MTTCTNIKSPSINPNYLSIFTINSETKGVYKGKRGGGYQGQRSGEGKNRGILGEGRGRTQKVHKEMIIN